MMHYITGHLYLVYKEGEDGASEVYLPTQDSRVGPHCNDVERKWMD